ncbi:hypothetical protein ACIRYZ_14790 [Kitasatospora sp. NPDC101155]|uniref:hypothetical protein n=1 Tax=Kitasatospora sp. NPDC101155 TaxID=3364097 RepID=UPI0037F1A4A8
MTTAPTHADLATWLVEAAEAVAGIVTAQHSTPPSRSYLQPVLGPLAAGPDVVGELAFRLEDLLTEEYPATPAVLFTVASYASALGWLTESLAELTQVVDLLCTRAGLPGTADAGAGSASEVAGFDMTAYSTADQQAIVALADEADLPPGLYLHVLGGALVACAAFAEACTEITSGLFEDARELMDESVSAVPLGGEGPGSLPTLVRSLLSRMETAE